MRSVFSSRIFIFTSFLIVLTATLIAFLPWAASTQWGNRRILDFINSTIEGTLEVRKMQFSWSGDQKLEGVLLKDPQGASVLGLEKLSIQAGLWKVLNKSTHLGMVEIQDLNLVISTDQTGMSNLQRVFGITPEVRSSIHQPSTVLLSSIQATLDLFSDHGRLGININGKSRQDTLSGSFELDCDCSNLEMKNWSDLPSAFQKLLNFKKNHDLRLNAYVVNLPVEIIDRFTDLKHPNKSFSFFTLIGETLSFKIEKEPNQEDFICALTASSPLFQGKVRAKIDEGYVTLEEAAAFQLTLLSETLWLLSDERIDFSDPALLTIKLEDLRIPLSEFTSHHPDAYGFKAYLKLSQPQEKRPAKKEVQGLHIEAFLDVPLTARKIIFGLNGKGEFNGEAFSVGSEFELEKPHHPIRFEEVIAQNFQGKCTFTHLPFKWFSIFEEHLALSKLLGPHADLFCAIASNTQKSPQLTVSLSTPRLSMEAAQFNLLPELSLIAPATVHWKGDQECLKPFLGPHLRLNRPCELWLQVKELAVPMRTNESIQIKAEAAVQGLEFLSLTQKTFVLLDDCLLKCEGSLPSYLNGELTSRLAVTQIDHSPHALLPNPLSLKFNLNFEHRQDELYAVPNFDMHLFSEEMEIQLGGRVDLKEGVLATDEGVCHFLLTPQGWDQLEAIGRFSKLHLNHPARLSLRVRPTRVMLESGWLSQIRSEGTFHADQLVFMDVHGTLSYIDQIDLPWKIEAPDNQITATLKSGLKIEKKAKAAPLFATLKLDNWLMDNQTVFEQAKFEFTTELRSLATPFFAVWLNMEDPTPLIGPLVDLDLKTSLDLSRQNPGYWDMHLDSALLHLKARIKVGDHITLYQSNKPTAEVRWTMTPEGYHYLENLKGRAPAAFSSHLAKPVVFTAYLSMLDLPLKTSNSWIDGGALEGYLSTSEFVWMDGADLPHMKLEAELKSQNLIQKIAVKAKIEENAPSAAHFTPLLFSATLHQVIDSMGRLKNGPETTIQALLETSQFPLISLKHSLLINPNSFKALEAFWGQQIEGTCKLDMQHMDGTFTAEIKGLNGSSSLSGKMQNGIFTLSSPFEVHVDLSPATIRFFSDQSIPLLESVLSASETLDLVIEPKNFSLPLTPFDLSEWTIGKGKLNLGKIFFKNEKDLEAITSLIPSLQDPSFAIWFTPIYFSLDQNQLTLERFDMQVAGTYTLASWGTIQLESMKTNLILGVSSDTLRSVFHIDPDAGYLLQIPIKGKNGKLGIDKTKALARIGALAAQTQGGIQGKIVGSLLDATLSENLEFSPPSPTTSPFPWEVNGELEENGTQIDATKNKVSVKKKANKKQLELKIDPEPLIKGLLERLTR